MGMSGGFPSGRKKNFGGTLSIGEANFLLLSAYFVCKLYKNSFAKINFRSKKIFTFLFSSLLSLAFSLPIFSLCINGFIAPVLALFIPSSRVSPCCYLFVRLLLLFKLSIARCFGKKVLLYILPFLYTNGFAASVLALFISSIHDYLFDR